MKSAEAHNGSKRYCDMKIKNSCELNSEESTTLSQWLIHGDVCNEACKVAVGAFVLALVTTRLFDRLKILIYESIPVVFVRSVVWVGVKINERFATMGASE